jgi:streptomycin 6-kinase
MIACMFDVDSIPEPVRNKARVSGRLDWLDSLPDILAELRVTWGVETGRASSDSTEAFVCEATRSDGSPAVIKVMVPRPGGHADHEVTVLRFAEGRGCVRMFDYEAAHQAMLLERLGPSLSDLGLPIRRRHEILTDTARRLWRPAPGAALPSGAWKAAWLADQIRRSWETLGRPCSERVIDQALACAERRAAAHDDERSVLVHGDVHQWNVLSAGSGDFKLVDPDGLLAEPEYDLGIIMREDPLELTQGDPDERARWLAARSGLDATAIREWGIVERVSTGLLCLEIDLQPVGQQMLDAAEFVAGS